MILDSLIDPSSVTPVDALWISLLAIGIVIFTLVIVILITTLFQKGMAAVEARTEILPRKENKILSTDEDAVAAALGTDLERLHCLVDGLPVATLPQAKSLVKGDAKSLLIAAASILAKTARDADCLRLERLYPGYGFAKHKGYPTKEHLAALARLGPCPEHRRSFGPVMQMELDI